MTIDHPLVPTSFRDALPRRRPRFTTSEAVILNALVNAAPEPVSLASLQVRLRPFATNSYAHRVGITEASVRQHLVSIRAKLGDTKGRPDLIVSVLDEHRRLVGYRWVGEPD